MGKVTFLLLFVMHGIGSLPSSFPESSADCWVVCFELSSVCPVHHRLCGVYKSWFEPLNGYSVQLLYGLTKHLSALSCTLKGPAQLSVSGLLTVSFWTKMCASKMFLNCTLNWQQCQWQVISQGRVVFIQWQCCFQLSMKAPNHTIYTQCFTLSRFAYSQKRDDSNCVPLSVVMYVRTLKCDIQLFNIVLVIVSVEVSWMGTTTVCQLKRLTIVKM